jgi:3-polyprenyl-4-hydroxybenzoate decarboxylase
MKRLIVGISGASGAIYGVRLLQVLRDVAEVETHLVMSQAARQTSLWKPISPCAMFRRWRMWFTMPVISPPASPQARLKRPAW